MSRKLRVRRLLYCTMVMGLGNLPAAHAEDPKPNDSNDRSIQLFNAKDVDGWYTYTTTTKHENPGVFQFVEGMIYVPGGKDDVAYFGGIVTKRKYENYRLRFEYKWGPHTYGRRKDKARDAGVLLHCVGPNEPGPWMTSYEFQIIEGGTGDLLVVNTEQGDDAGREVTLLCTAESEERDAGRFFRAGSEPFTFKIRKGGERLNWWGRDPDWKDEVDFRGRQDVESPFGEWTKCEIIARDNTLTYYVNGQLVNRVTDLNITKGKIFFQTEGAELWYRNIELTPLKKPAPSE